MQSLKCYHLKDRTCCCDPFNKHLNRIKVKSLKSISLNFVYEKSSLIPKKKTVYFLSFFIAFNNNEAESQISTPGKKIDRDEDYCESIV